MKQISWIRAMSMVCVVALAVAGCGGGDGDSAATDESFAALQAQKSALDSKRQEVADLQMQIDAAMQAPEEEGEGDAEGEGAEAGPSVEELGAEMEQAQGAIDAQSEEFMNSLVTFLNEAGMVEGEAPTGNTLAAIRMKSDEDMIIAQEYVDQGGDYRRAMDILATAMMLDPDNPDLQAAVANYEELQFMTEERFAAVSKGMTMGEVRARLGTVNRNNIRNYEDKDVTAWFYRREDKGAAAVYFEEKDGEMVAYRADYDAIKPGDEEEG